MKKRILTGAESFEKIIAGDYFYVDKTLFIKELLDKRGEVTLITRPRRFGKTMNMSMLEHFFGLAAPSGIPAAGEGKGLFDGLKIMEHGDIVEKHKNKYPVIFLTLKNVEFPSYENSVDKIRILVSSIYQQKMYLYETDGLNEFKKKKFYRYCSEEATEIELQSALLFLTECLYTYHGKRAIVLLDEYDAPLTNAYVKGFYNEMVEFMRGFLGGTFKTNDSLEFGVLTGVQRISKEGLFSSFNNPKVCGIMDEEFATDFGFTEEEVKDACVAYGLGESFNEAKRWYDGYRFGGQDMYNPWSITGYLDRRKFDEYWVNTGSTSIFKDIFHKGDISLKDNLAGLITGAPVMMYAEDGITYPLEYSNSNAFWNLMLNAGYVKPCNGTRGLGDKFGVELVNMEVRNMFARTARIWFETQQQPVSKAISRFVGCLLQGDSDGVAASLNDDLLNNPSCHDYKEENSYHMFIYGMLLAVSDGYTVYSNPESGKGRSDCMIKPHDKEKHAVVIEFKHRGADGKDLKEEAQKGLEQIEEKAYMHNLRREGYTRIYKYGIAFHKKTCEVAMETVK
ncbi:MAG: ATP-binding protein [Synergistaceae bacterium]|nr:ATP-binding protein [Synergistaceae bacterium]